jgi:hypothetical protein
MIKMPRKTKPSRISLRKPSEDRRYKPALLHPEDHAKIPGLAARLKTAHPDTEFSKVADILHFCIEAGEKALEQGA